MEQTEGGGGTQRRLDAPSAERAGATAVMVGGLLLAGFAVSHVLKSSRSGLKSLASGPTSEQPNRRPYDPEEPPPDPELGAWG